MSDTDLIRRVIFIMFGQGEVTERKWELFLNRLSRDRIRIEELVTKADVIIQLVRQEGDSPQ